MNSIVELLAALGAHLTEFELPPIASVHVGTAPSALRLTVQLTCHQPPAIAQGLLAWADTLTDVAAQAWRVPRGDSVHLSVTGRLPCNASVLVYGGVWGTHRDLGADLAPEATTTIPLSMLRHAATIEEVRA
jgi:FtsP/CotA-like multicopper oxidase with cupredoxin domain